MTNKFSINPDEEDAKTILHQFTIQKYLRHRLSVSGGVSILLNHFLF